MSVQMDGMTSDEIVGTLSEEPQRGLFQARRLSAVEMASAVVIRSIEHQQTWITLPV